MRICGNSYRISKPKFEYIGVVNDGKTGWCLPKSRISSSVEQAGSPYMPEHPGFDAVPLSGGKPKETQFPGVSARSSITAGRN